ncbi:chromate transporter [Moraxella atlantae]|uniref:Chromate transporter n=1 Tax=Faucicola atlantae TaxID=34059 RepID=A0A1B8QF70_9GAMM|nr:chromate efflux transporter [Moraxella atlantae]OBX80610.1 chromate transporter [Moraxella atlantae]
MPNVPLSNPESTAFAKIEQPSVRTVWVVFWVFLQLGCTSFGGPIAHLGYFRQIFVEKRNWLSDAQYADTVALCQFLPGPASSQVGMAIGWYRAGLVGALAAWLGFTLPSAVALMGFAVLLQRYPDVVPAGLVHGLKLLAVAVVWQAVWGMAHKLTPDKPRLTVAVLSAVAVLCVPTIWAQLAVMVMAAVVGWWQLQPRLPSSDPTPQASVLGKASAKQTRLAMGWLLAFAGLLVGLPLLQQYFAHQDFANQSLAAHGLAVFDAFYRTGALVFGGGHVVLPLLQAQTVAMGWVDNATFLAGYGAAQAVPGPLFTFAAFLGASMSQPPNGWQGGLLALVAIFLPSFLLVLGVLPVWQRLRTNHTLQAALLGVNAAVVGVLLAALYNPVWVSAVGSVQDFAVVLFAIAALMIWRLPVWMVVIGCALAGIALAQT